MVGPASVESAAIFPVASMAQHSCTPNVETSTKRGARMRYVAVVDIAAGEAIAMSYLESTLDLAPREVDADLRNSK